MIVNEKLKSKPKKEFRRFNISNNSSQIALFSPLSVSQSSHNQTHFTHSNDQQCSSRSLSPCCKICD